MATFVPILLALLAAVAPTDPRTETRSGEKVIAEDLAEIDRDDAAAEAAADAGDFTRALRYMDFFGHEQEAFATAILEYGRDQRKLRRAVLDKLGERAWRRAARALGIPRHRGPAQERSVRR